MLVSGKQILGPAHANGFAVPAFNLSDYGILMAAFEACEEINSPLIVALGPAEGGWIGEDFVPAVLSRARRSSIPTALHWDHGASLQEAVVALRRGYTSVMIDASRETFEANVEVTSRVVEVAHAAGVSVEGEIGTIGTMQASPEGGGEDILYTDPSQASEYVERTGVDSLAIAIGTRHGLYPSDLKPRIRLELLAAIASEVNVPLVLHGGSDNPDHEIAEACKAGINKVNISSDVKAVFFDGMREALRDASLRDPRLIVPIAAARVKELVLHKVGLFGSGDTAHYYQRV